jgi:dienelactone hydrolase
MIDATLGEWVTSVPAGGFTEPELEVTVYRPPGDGPFPIVVINHGRAPGDARFQPRYRPLNAAREFVQLGYAVVVPMRQGFSKSGGNEISGGCNISSNGLQQARSVRRTLDWLATQPWADVSRNIVVGQSHGGLATMAYGMQPHPGTRLLLNFAGGLRQASCPDWQKEMISAFGDYGAATRLPSIWFYGDNDSFFPPQVVNASYARYREAGGPADLVSYGRFGSDSHTMFGTYEGVARWLPRVRRVLAELHLPHQQRYVAADPGDAPLPVARGHARLDELEKLPVANEAVRQGYQAWLRARPPKAFAVHPSNGGWASAWGGARPRARALGDCERLAKAPCRLYAVDDTVVWSDE